MTLRSTIVAVSWLWACGGDDGPGPRDDAGAVDAGAGEDGGAPDSGTDAGDTVDASATDDAGPGDADAGADAGPLVTYTEVRDPCSARTATRRALFGDLHVHTSYSFDAWVFGVRNDPVAAYRFARGEAVPLAEDGEGPRMAQLDRPLDFAAVTDHSEFLGETSLCTTPGSAEYDSMTCATYRSGLAGFVLFGADLAQPMPRRNAALCGLGGARCDPATRDVWMRVIDAAHGAYDRTSACAFTSLVAYEWTGSTGGSTLHRNVVFRNGNVPAAPISYYEEPTPQGLWDALRAQCTDAGVGCDVLAIPHNPNISNGRAFDVAYPGAATMPEQIAQATLRAATEPLFEISQHKGSSECAPFFSTDEECGFEYAGPDTLCNGDGTGTGNDCTSRQDYARGALIAGLAEERRLGVNPFQVGFVGATDTHNGTPGNTREETFAGHVGEQDGTATDRLGDALVRFAPGGLTGVWAVENSRDAIFDALSRRETFATSGARIQVRFFGGWTYPTDLCADAAMLDRAYADGVAMGGTLGPRPAGEPDPRFVVWAAQDGVPLERVQVVKGTVATDGTITEQVLDVVAAAPGATVDLSTCTPVGAGLAMPCEVWVDEDFDATARAFYYARVLQSPTCRWSTRDCNALPAASRPAACTDPTIPRTVQERAWSSPIWYAPD